ncbi:MAG: ABC transporter ATP-binding protein [Sphaerobacter sp.]|nr:ABC transporter ATP-binding protein [Sphaerobacter sp.]
MDAIVAEHLRKTYRNGVRAVEDVTFRVAPGEIFGLLGPNGAGKSTTVRILATLTQPDGGTARVAGHDVRRDPAGVRRKLGYVAQVSGVDKHATGRENLTLQAHLHRVPRRQVRERVERVLAWVGLTDAADRMVRTYSGGMQRRLDIALALVHEPEVLFLDEPTTGLDPETRAALWDDLVRLKRERGLAVLLTTHYLDEADRLCDRLAIVDRGRVVVEGTPAELKAGVRGDRVTLEVEQRPAEAAAVLQSLDRVLEVVPNGREVIARVLHGATAIPQLVTVLERAGITVQSVALQRPSLDDVYLFHTGHRMITDDLAPDGLGSGEERRSWAS